MIEKYKKLCPFKWFVLTNFPFIEEDFDAITNYELYCKLAEYVNKIAKSTNDIGSEMETVVNSFNDLKDYVDNYFDNLDVTEEVNAKLDEMVESGDLTEIIQNSLFNIPININVVSRIFREYEDTYYIIKGITSYSNNIVMLCSDSLGNFKVYTYNVVSDTLSSFTLNLSSLSDVMYMDNKLYFASSSTTIYACDIDGANVTTGSIDTPIKCFDFLSDYIYVVDTANNFVILNDDFSVSNSSTSVNINAISIVATAGYIAFLKENSELVFYKENTANEFVYNNTNFLPTKANKCFVTGIYTAITKYNNNIIFGTNKKVIPNKDFHVFNLFEGNPANSVNSNYLENLSYNSTRYEAEIHVGTNASYNPTGTTANPFPHIYEGLEVFENGEFTKGNILHDVAVSYNNLIITDINKKLGLYFNNSEINGMEFRNSTYIEVNGAEIIGHFENTENALVVVGGIKLVLATTTIDTDSVYDIYASYDAEVSILQSTTINNKLATQYGGIIKNKNNSTYAQNIALDRTSKFSPNYCLIWTGTAGQSDEIELANDITYFSSLKFEIIVNTISYWIELPTTGLNKNISLAHFVNQKFYLVNFRIDIDNTNNTAEVVSVKELDVTAGTQTTPSTEDVYLKTIWGIT